MRVPSADSPSAAISAMTGARLPRGAEVAVTAYQGPHSDIDLAYGRLGSYVAEHELEIGWQLREYYHRDHSHTSDHTQWRTEIAWPIIDSPAE